jgi:DNA-binding response OmpR family regulator
MSKQMKYCTRTLDDRAPHEQVALVLLLGSTEQAQQAVVAKNLADASQTLVPLTELAAFLRNHARRDGTAASGQTATDSLSSQPLTFRMLRDACRQQA